MMLRWLFVALLGCASAGSPSMFGEITSPNYPQVYPNDAVKTWNIQVPEGYGIRLYFTHVDIEPSENCEYDSLQVIIGNKVEQAFCGSHSFGSSGFPKEKFYLTTQMKLTFKSDFSNQERHTGFAAYYVASDVDECETSDPCSHFCNNYIGGFFCSCPPEYELQEDQNTCGVNCSGGLYTDLRGQISSPGYPSPYPENSRCGYKVLLESGYQVILTFKSQDFDIEAPKDGSCIYDSLTIKAKGKTFGPYCGKQPPPRIETGSNEVDIDFITDSGGDNIGWKIYYYEDAIPCPTDMFHHSILNPLPKKGKYVFKDMVTVKCEEGFEIVSQQKRLPSFRTKCQGDGTWSQTHKCEPVNCGDPEEIDNGEVDFVDTTYGVKAVYTCKSEYYTLLGDDTFICSMDGLWKNSNKNNELPRCIGVCGISSSPETRILGGKKAENGYFPWLVGITTSSNFGGGSLISDRWVVTAAHFLQQYDKPSLQVGDVDNQQAVTILSKKVIIHPEWIPDTDEEKRVNYNNDIALIQLAKRIELDDCICPVCLPQKGVTAYPAIGELGYIAGWGATRNTTAAQGKKIRILRYAGIPLHDLEGCKKIVPETYTVTSNMLCAGGEGKDSCQGDSGGPLMFEDLNYKKNKRLYIAGIVSWGVGCGQSGMYTKVQNYLDWIEKTIEGENKENNEEQPEIVKICKK